MQSVSYLSNDLAYGLSTMDTSPVSYVAVLLGSASAESGSLVYW